MNWQLIAGGADHAAFTVALQASEPFLDHHRPGGQPLLGTAMGIALIAQAAAHFDEAHRGWPRVIENVAILEPLILQTASAAVRVLVQREGPQLRCAVVSDRAGTALPHLKAVVPDPVAPAAPTTPAPRALPPALQQRLANGRHPVYELYFHGPAFRVVGHACWIGDTLWSELQPGLSPLANAKDAAGLAPVRWIELCMQTAGLLEIARNERMMIPHRIARLELFAWQGSQSLMAAAVPGVAGTDIDLLDAQGLASLRMTGYETVPLPFASDTAALRRLAESLRASHSG